MNKIMSARGGSASGGKKIILFLLFLLLPFCFARAEDIAERLKGKILLQVESAGEAWYINPDNQMRFYLGRPTDAFRIMGELGLGISNKDFETFAGVAPKRLSGKILLKVEDKGQAYYVNPVDLKMSFLGRPSDAFNIMREQGLGISNNDLSLIEIDEASTPLPGAQEEAVESDGEDISEEASEEEEVVEDIEEPEQTATTTDETDQDIEEDTATSSKEVIEEPSEISTSTCEWKVEYFNNKSLIGTPVATSSIDFIDFNWERGSPDELNRNDNFSMRFIADCYFEEGIYKFSANFDDAIRVYFDNIIHLGSWADNDRERILNRDLEVEEGVHEIKVEYYDAVGNAKISVDWVKLN